MGLGSQSMLAISYFSTKSLVSSTSPRFLDLLYGSALVVALSLSHPPSVLFFLFLRLASDQAPAKTSLPSSLILHVSNTLSFCHSFISS